MIMSKWTKFGFFMLALLTMAVLGIGSIVMVYHIGLGLVMEFVGFAAAGSGFVLKARLRRAQQRV
ncbi:MAG: hypothetical protein OWT28_06535 [Firmicutes bacterium]|nr:hypothetical protein [Bacillota bacterium]